ncbi:hypothetical protein [Peribacillus sp. R9-11]|uniref:hypothetical protein n=1 Tax=Peribacillus sp. R9-11 TaxID=3073271 RepID=UPI0028686B07|nr:hypothetical protein [Peribacillus sp. R9-11]WMX58955.1 hypothetical protein RE409_30370 [Peribacillus sp. R9-11]
MAFLQQNIWWIGFALTFVIALFPTIFSSIGTALQYFCNKYWLQISIVIIISLLLFISVIQFKK